MAAIREWTCRSGLAVGLILAGACSNDHKAEPKAPEPAPVTDSAPTLPGRFATSLAKASGTTAAGDTVTIGTHALSLTTKIEEEAAAPGGRVAIGVKVSCTLDGARLDALTSGSVGIDSSRDAALGTAAEEWAMQFGTPIVEALAEKSPALQRGGYAIYAGPTGVRGRKPEGLAGVNEQLFQAIGPALPTLIPAKPGLHSMTITAVRKADGSVDGEFRVDGEASELLKTRALQMTWPASAEDYMLKQYYVLQREARSQ